MNRITCCTWNVSVMYFSKKQNQKKPLQQVHPYKYRKQQNASSRLGFNPDQQCRHCHKTLLWQKLKAVLCIQIRIHTLSLLTWYQLSHIKNRSHTVSPLMKKQNASRAIAARLRSLRSTGCYVKITKLLFEYKSTDGVKHDVLTHYTHFARSQALVKYSQQG